MNSTKLLIICVIIFSLGACQAAQQGNNTKTPPVNQQIVMETMVAELLTKASWTKTPTETPAPTQTKSPTSTPFPSATPIRGTFKNKLKIGDNIELPVIPEKFFNQGVAYQGKLEFTFQDVKFGNEALVLARNSLGYGFQNPISGQEYVAIKGHLKFDNQNDTNKVADIYPDWSLTLRYTDGGDDTWTGELNNIAEGYPPLEGDFWIYFLIREGSNPSLYFQPHLMIIEPLGHRTYGVYFEISRKPQN